VAASPRTPGLAVAVDAAAAARVGVDEGLHRWNAEPDREPVDRAVRAIADGALNAGGIYGGASGGAAVGSAICGAVQLGVPGCAAAASYVGGWLGHRAGEWLSDQLLGDEPEAWEQEPEAFAAEIADVDDETIDALRPIVDDAADATAEAVARQHDFLLEVRRLIGPPG
jgi:phage tail tape-measure protein